MDLNELRATAATCQLCNLYRGRINPVFDKGNPESSILICGMVPAAEENQSGLPFVGRAGQLLDVILDKVDLTLEDVYVTNLVKCFLAAGEPLNDDWVSQCLPYVITQISLIRPKIIITLGKDASTALLDEKKNVSLKSLQGRLFDYADGIKIMPTYHPSYLLRTGGERSAVYKDVLKHFSVAKEIATS